MLRVDYPMGSRNAFGYSANLSRTGLHLRGAVKLAVGDAVPLALHLKTEPAPVPVDAVVRSLRGGSAPGVGLEFVPRDGEAVEAVHRFVEQELLAKYEAGLARSLGNVDAVVLVASYYVETE